MRSLEEQGGGPPAGGPEQAPTPYRDAAWTYRGAGWVGVLPIPYRSKALRASGWTGHAGAWPSAADVTAWCETTRSDEGGGNIALRLPPDVIGVDVDAYAGKSGAADLAAAVQKWGPLPDTWTSTARDDGISGIRLYRVPEGLRWPGQVGPAIEVIQHAHRYAVVWPSLHPEGRVYRWYRPDGMASLAPPATGELPDLPETWVAGLTGGELAETVHLADLSTGEVGTWLTAHSDGAPCRAMTAVADRFHADLRTGSAHEALRRLVGLVRFAEQGHAGLAAVLGQAHAAFLAEATNPARSGSARDEREAQAEWSRSLGGAVRRVLGDASVAAGETPADPCTQPFAGLIAPAGDPVTVEIGEPVAVPSPPTPAPDPAPPVEFPGITFPPPERSHHDEDVAPDSTPELGSGTDAGPEAAEETHTSWWPRDITGVLAGEQTEPTPAVLAREDEHCLFYSGKVNGLLGESESGKSWILLAAVVQCLQTDRPALYVDFEDTAEAVVGRLLSMGVDPALLEPAAGLFDYIAPDESLHALAAADLAALLARTDYALIGLDGYNAAMTLLGLDLQSNTDATKFAQTLLRPLARTGAAVITVDHVGKDKEARGKGGIGAQAKRAMVTGSSVVVEVLAPFGRGQTGKLKLTVDKDRPGHVRGFAENSKNVGIAVLESGSNGSVRVRIEAPGSAAANAPVREPWRPTAMMEKVSRFLSQTDGMLSQTQIEQGVDGRTVTVRRALELLVDSGHITRHPGPRNSLLHRYERTFREMDELVADTERDVRDSGW